MTVKVAVIYYSATGAVHALAQAVAEGAASAGAEARLRRVAELAPDSAIDAEPAVAAARRRRHVDPPGLGRGPGVGRRVRVRDADPVRRAGRAAQALHRPDRRAVAGGQAGRQAGDGLHLGVQPARRQRGHDPVAGQRLLPLGGADRPARIHRSGRVRRRRQPLRHVVCDRPGRRRPRRRGAGSGQATRDGGWPRSRSGYWGAASSPMPPRATGTPAKPWPQHLPDRVSGGMARRKS